MNKEIKEILDYFRKYSTIRENTMINEIEDYITNLQQENERLENDLENEVADNKLRLQENERLKEELIKIPRAKMEYDLELEDYKYRCEKAIEYFKYQLENLDFYEDTKARMLCAMGITLLQNGSDSQ